MSRGKTDAIFILHRWLWGILFLGVWLGGIPDRAVSAEDNDSRTWRTIAELSEEELARLDFSTDAPRHAGFPYMPAEPYPFKPPYTAEEIGYRIMEFPHMPRWDCVQIEDSGTLTPTGYLFINQIITLIHHRAPKGWSDNSPPNRARSIRAGWHKMLPPRKIEATNCCSSRPVRTGRPQKRPTCSAILQPCAECAVSPNPVVRTNSPTNPWPMMTFSGETPGSFPGGCWALTFYMRPPDFRKHGSPSPCAMRTGLFATWRPMS